MKSAWTSHFLCHLPTSKGGGFVVGRWSLRIIPQQISAAWKGRGQEQDAEEGSHSLHRAQNLEIWKCGNAVQGQSCLSLTFVCGCLFSLLSLACSSRWVRYQKGREKEEKMPQCGCDMRFWSWRDLLWGRVVHTEMIPFSFQVDVMCLQTQACK